LGERVFFRGLAADAPKLQELDLSALPRGTYFLWIRDFSGAVFSDRLIVLMD
jgi:hypothetical protein